MLAATTSLAVAALIHGLTQPLLSLILAEQGVDNTLIGLSAATQYLSVLAIAPFMPRLLRTSGPAWLMFWGVLSSVGLLLLLPVFRNFYAWFPLRFLLGIAASLLWIAGEAWVNHSAEEHTRGRVVAIYCMALAAGFSLGPLILVATGSAGWTPFVVAAAIMLLAIIPLFMTLKDGPKLEGHPSASLVKYLWLAPVTMWVYLVFSMTDTILLTFLPLYGIGSGLDEQTAIILITIMGIGGIALQLPIGWLADHMDRMLLMALAIVFVLVGTALFPVLIAHTPWNAIFMFFFGGTFVALYTVPMVLLGQQFKNAELSAAATVFSIMFCAGSIIGPPISGAAMELAGINGMPLVLALAYLCVLPLPVIAYLRRQPYRK